MTLATVFFSEITFPLYSPWLVLHLCRLIFACLLSTQYPPAYWHLLPLRCLRYSSHSVCPKLDTSSPHHPPRHVSPYLLPHTLVLQAKIKATYILDAFLFIHCLIYHLTDSLIPVLGYFELNSLLFSLKLLPRLRSSSSLPWSAFRVLVFKPQLIVFTTEIWPSLDSSNSSVSPHYATCHLRLPWRLRQ